MPFTPTGISMTHRIDSHTLGTSLSEALLLAGLLIWQPAAAADDAIEREQLAALVRQVDLIDSLAEHAASAATGRRNRYHFNHTRLREDIQRIRAGINDYLTPPRAQPRDPVELLGDYRQSIRPSDDAEAQ